MYMCSCVRERVGQRERERERGREGGREGESGKETEREWGRDRERESWQDKGALEIIYLSPVWTGIQSGQMERAESRHCPALSLSS